MQATNGRRPVMVTRETVTPRRLQRLRQVVQTAARRAGLTAQRSFHLVLAVNEAATNVIKHAGGRGHVEVLQDDRRRLIAVVSDQGPGLPPDLSVDRPPLEAAGGRGLWLISQVCDRVEVRTGAGGTQLHLEMSIPG